MAKDELAKLDFKKFLNSLSEQELQILRRKLGPEIERVSSLEELASLFQVSRESIARIEERARKILAGRDVE